MATNNREVALNIKVGTSGQEAVRNLKEAVGELAKQGGDAGPQFTKLSSELDKIAAQQDAIDTFAQLRREVAQLGEQMTQASARVDALGASLPEAAQKTLGLRDAQNKLKAELESLQGELRTGKDALEALDAQYEVGKRKGTEYGDVSRQLKAALADTRKEISAKRQELVEASSAVRDAVKEEKALTREYETSITIAKDLSNEVGRKNKALEESRSTLRANGIESKSLAEVQSTLRGAFKETSDEIAKQADALAKAKTFTQQLDQAQKLLDAEIEISTASRREAVQAENERIASIKASAEATRAAAAQSAAALERAFAQTGVRSAQAIQAEIREINTALDTIARSSKTTGEQFDRAFAAAQGRIQKLNDEMLGVTPIIERTTTATRFLSSTLAQLTASFGAIEIGRGFINANVQLEAMRRTLTLVTGSAAEAERQIAFLKETANTSGVAVNDLARAYSKFAASASASGISLETVNATFAAVTRAMGNLGASSDDTASALSALGQMASKGKVSLEELQQQLGDRMPAVLAVTAKALGVTTSQLVTLISSGELIADEAFFKPFAQSVQETFGGGTGEIEGFSQALGRLRNSLSQLSTDIGDSGVMKALASVIDLTAKNMGTLASATGGLIQTFLAFKAIAIARDFLGIGTAAAGAAAETTVFKTASDQATRSVAVQSEALVANTAVTRANAAAKGAAAVATEAASVAYGKIGTAIGGVTGRIGSLIGALGGPYGAALTVAIGFSDQLGKAIADVAARFTGLKAELEANEKKLKDQAAAEAELARQAKFSAEIRSQSATQIKASYIELEKAATDNTLAAKKLVDAKEREATAAELLVKLTGDEVAIRNQAVTSINATTAAAEAWLARSTLETNQLLQKREALINAAGGVDRMTAAEKEYIETLDRKIEKSQADLADAKARTDAFRNEAVEAKALADATKDNSGRVDELRAARDKAAATYERYVNLEKQGLVVGTDLDKMKRELIQREKEYADALSDSNAKLQQRVEKIRADAATVQAGLTVKAAEAEANERIARAQGNETAATQAGIQQKRIQIDTIRASTQAKIAEANATIAALEKQLSETKGSDDAARAKRTEIELRIQNEKAKIVEAGATNFTIKGIEAEIAALGRLASANREAIALTKERTFAEEVAAGEKERQDRRIAEGRTPTADANDGLLSLENKRKNGSLSSADLATAQAVYDAAAANLEIMQQNSTAFSLNGQRSVEAAYNSARSILESLNSGGSAKGGSAIAGGGSTTTVNVNLGGLRSSVNVATPQDAQALTGIFRQIENAAGTAS